VFLIVICISILLGLVVHVAYRDMCPAKVFSYFWIVQILVLVIGGYGFLIFNYKGLLFILACILFLNLGTLSFSWSSTPSLRQTQKRYAITFNESRLKYILAAVIALGFVNPLMMIVSHGFSLTGLFSLTELTEISSGLSMSRYQEESSSGLLQQLLGVFSSLGPLLGGFMFKHMKKRWERLLCCASFLPLLFGGLTQGVKMGIISGVLLFLTGLMTYCMLMNVPLKLNGRSLAVAFASGFGLMLILILSMMMRFGELSLISLGIALGKIVSYAFGHLPAFDAWFSTQSLVPDSLTFGGKLLFGITNFLGIMSREDGLFQEMAVVSVAGDETNVYTLFRILVEDFGVLGTPLFFFLLGRFMQRIYLMLRRGTEYKLTATLMTAFLFFTFWSFATSVFAYTSYVVLFCVFYIIMVVSTKKNVSLKSGKDCTKDTSESVGRP